MENYVFKKDYLKETNSRIPKDELTPEDILPSPLARDYLKFHNEFMRRLPKIVVQNDKETFERVVPKLNEFAKRLHGTIEATVDYQKWESHIIMVLPLLEFYRDSDKELFLDILKNSHGFNVTATEDGKVRLYILINYFQEIMPKDWDEIADDVILGLSEEDYE